MHIDKSLQFFVENTRPPRAIVIRGRWGVGKTYYWRERVVKGFFANATLRRVDRGYAYASLFGVESIQQLKNALAFSYAENQQPGVLRSAWRAIRRWPRRVYKFVRKGVADELSIGAKGVGVKVKLTSLVDDFAFHSIRGCLVCIDDVERRNKKLSIGDVLGLVSYLVDQRECRVAVILNFDALDSDEQGEWERVKDKTFEVELLYKPSMEESIEVGMAGAEHESWHAVATDSLRRLRIDNVRVVARTQRFVRQLVTEMKKDGQLANLPEDAWQDVVKMACLLAAAYASRGVGAPSVDELASNRLFVMSNKEKEQERLTDDQKEWRAVVQSYGLYLGDRLDHAIGESVKEGYPRMDLLVPAALDWQQTRDKITRAQKFLDAWRLYHDSLNTDAETLFERFQEAIPGVIGDESVTNISGTGVLFRELGRSGAATELFQAWIDARKNARTHELDVSEVPGGLIDREFLALIGGARASLLQTNMPVLEALAKIESRVLSDEVVFAISSAAPDEIVKALTSHDRNWSRCVQALAAYSGHGSVGVRARENFKEALRQISAASSLNSMRIKGMLGGVSLDPVDDEASLDEEH